MKCVVARWGEFYYLLKLAPFRASAMPMRQRSCTHHRNALNRTLPVTNQCRSEAEKTPASFETCGREAIPSSHCEAALIRHSPALSMRPSLPCVPLPPRPIPSAHPLVDAISFATCAMAVSDSHSPVKPTPGAACRRCSGFADGALADAIRHAPERCLDVFPVLPAGDDASAGCSRHWWSTGRITATPCPSP